MKQKQLKNLIYLLLLSTTFTTTYIHAKWETTNNNCKVWVEGDITKDTVKWSGKCKDGFASGKGEVSYNYLNEHENKICVGKMLKGKIDGYTSCEMNNGNTFVGTVENDKVIGIGIYKWNLKNCPTCPIQYQGKFFNNLFSEGILILANKKERKLYFHPSTEDCLVWNKDFTEDEKIIWSGKCKDGYADGKGILKFIADTKTETLNGRLKNGMIEGYAVFNTTLSKNCNNCPVHFEGIFKNSEPIKGVVTFGNGQKKKINMSAKMDKAMDEYVKSQHLNMLMMEVGMGRIFDPHRIGDYNLW